MTTKMIPSQLLLPNSQFFLPGGWYDAKPQVPKQLTSAGNLSGAMSWEYAF